MHESNTNFDEHVQSKRICYKPVLEKLSGRYTRGSVFKFAQFSPGACSQIFYRLNIVEHFVGWKFCSRGWTIPMKSLIHTEELCSWSVPLEHAPGAKFLVCIGLKSTSSGSQISIICVHLCRCIIHYSTPFAVHDEKIRIHLCETATNSVKIHSLARKSEHLRINHIQ